MVNNVDVNEVVAIHDVVDYEKVVVVIHDDVDYEKVAVVVAIT